MAARKSNQLAVVYQPVADLIPYVSNARTHSEEQVAQIAASIREFGFTNPILVDGSKGIIAGHGRLQAARKLGLNTVPTIELHGLSDTQRRAYILADNKLALNAGWDNELLALELGDLAELDFDLSLVGFDDDELAALLADKTEGLTDEDAVPELQARTVSVPGDVWVLGKHRLRCGDSTSADDVASLMDGSRAALVFTDPPYGVGYQSNMRTKTDKFGVLKNDDTLLDFAPIVAMFSDGWVFVWTSWKVQTQWIENFIGLGYPSNMVVWHKPGGGIGDLKKTFASDYEVALVWNRGANLCGKRVGSVWRVGKDAAASYVHPTQKPVELSVEAIDKTTRAGAIVLDLFGGSGSTLIGCEKTGRVCRMMELDERYCDVIVRRWQEFTGKKATHADCGSYFDDLQQERHEIAGWGEAKDGQART